MPCSPFCLFLAFGLGFFVLIFFVCFGLFVCLLVGFGFLVLMFCYCPFPFHLFFSSLNCRKIACFPFGLLKP